VWGGCVGANERRDDGVVSRKLLGGTGQAREGWRLDPKKRKESQKKKIRVQAKR